MRPAATPNTIGVRLQLHLGFSGGLVVRLFEGYYEFKTSGIHGSALNLERAEDHCGVDAQPLAHPRIAWRLIFLDLDGPAPDPLALYFGCGKNGEPGYFDSDVLGHSDQDASEDRRHANAGFPVGQGPGAQVKHDTATDAQPHMAFYVAGGVRNRHVVEDSKCSRMRPRGNGLLLLVLSLQGLGKPAQLGAAAAAIPCALGIGSASRTDHLTHQPSTGTEPRLGPAGQGPAPS